MKRFILFICKRNGNNKNKSSIRKISLYRFIVRTNIPYYNGDFLQEKIRNLRSYQVIQDYGLSDYARVVPAESCKTIAKIV